MNTPRVVNFHGLRPSGWVDGLSEIWLHKLAEPALLACRVDVHADARVELELSLPEAVVRLASPIIDPDGPRGAAVALHACFTSAEQILRDRRGLLTGKPSRPVRFVASHAPAAAGACSG